MHTADPVAQAPEDDGEEVCRVCRTEAEPDNPLYHPCKCSGSIRYVHSECLVEWLGHSNKKNCELCGYAFSFKKVYPADMPESLPFPALAIKFLKDALRIAAKGLWAIVVAINWLIVLPLMIMYVFRGMFSVGHNLGMKFSGTPLTAVEVEVFNRTSRAQDLLEISQALKDGLWTSSTLAETVANSTMNKPYVPVKTTWGDDLWLMKTVYFGMPGVRTVFLKAMWYRVLNRFKKNLLQTIFNGQMLAVAIIVAFLGIFLVREWVNQNGTIENTRADAPEMGGPAAPEDFRPNMRVRWRHRDTRARSAMRGILEPGVALRRARNQLREDYNAEVEFPPIGGQRRDHAEIRIIDEEGPLEVTGGEDDDDEWIEETDTFVSTTALFEEQGAAFPRQDQGDSEDEVDLSMGHEPMETDEVLADMIDESNVEATREARNRYFAVADHNRHFADQAPEVPPSPGRPEPTAAQTYKSKFSFDFDVGPAADGPSQSGSGNNNQFLGIINPTDIPLPPSRPDDTFDHLDQLFPPRQAIAGQPAVPNINPLDLQAIARRLREEGHADADDDVVVQGVEIRPGADDLPEDEEEGDGLILEGDIDGIFEALGLFGPPIVLVQNAFIVMLVLSSTLTLFIHFPYVIGKVHLLGDISAIALPVRGLFLVAKGITIITDVVLKVLSESLTIVLVRPVRSVLGLTSSGIDASSASSGTTQATLSGLVQVTKKISALLPSFVVAFATKSFDKAETALALLGSRYTSYREATYALGGQDTVFARATALAFGYFDIFFSLMIMSTLGERGLGRPGKAIAEAVASYGTVLKLAVFMLIELAVFPITMGYVVDFCSLPLFPDGTRASRMLTQQRHPVLSSFAHWICGTLFMFAFARFLSTCRAVCRRGAMYMVRDPADPSFSPVRDILERSTIAQTKKLLVSALMYLAVLSLPLGGILTLLRYAPLGFNVLPLRWYYKETPSTVPADFIALLLVVPQFLPNLRSNPQFKKLLRFYWSSFAHWLRLSAYFKGVRHRHEETAGPIERRLLHAHKRWTLFKRTVTFSKAPLPSYEDSYMRVPYADSVPLVRPRRNVFVPVNERGIPLTDEGKITVVYQDRVCRAANRNPSKDYMMVHLPALYPLRFWIFCISIWLAVSWTLALVIFTPIVVGRQLTFAYYGYWVHDGYSFFAGAWALSQLQPAFLFLLRHFREPGYSYSEHLSSLPLNVWQMVIPRVTDFMEDTDYRIYRFERGVVLYALAPLMLGLGLDLYVFFPLKYGVSDMTPVFYAAEAWAFGAVVQTIITLRPRLRRAMIKRIAPPEEIVANDGSLENWLDDATPLALLVPLAKAVLALVIAPLVTVILITAVGTGLSGWTEHRVALTYRFIYPTILGMFLAVQGMILISFHLKRWSRHVLEAAYLIEKRVINIEEAVEPGTEVTEIDPGVPREEPIWADE